MLLDSYPKFVGLLSEFFYYSYVSLWFMCGYTDEWCIQTISQQ